MCAFAVTGEADTSVITSTYEVTHTRFASRLLVPFAALQNIRRLKNNAELRAGVKPEGEGDAVKNALITGALTFASFFALFGLSAAAMLIVLILIHEVGHVIAMRWAGIPVKGIYFVPFFGGVAVSAKSYASEAERGLVALMGPGFSLATTALFLMLAMQSPNDTFMRELALMSALLNGFNLLPVMPLDGGHVMQSLLSRFSAGTARIFNIVALIAGGALALAIKSYVLLLVLLLVAPGMSSERANGVRLPQLTWGQWAMLLAAYLATFFFYFDAFVTLSALAPSEAAGGG